MSQAPTALVYSASGNLLGSLGAIAYPEVRLGGVVSGESKEACECGGSCAGGCACTERASKAPPVPSREQPLPRAADVESHFSGASLRPGWCTPELLEEWVDLSEVVYASRIHGLGSLHNDALWEAARARSGTAFGPLYAAWAIDNLVFDGWLEEACEAATRVLPEVPPILFEDRSAAGVVLETLAHAHRALGNRSPRIDALQHWATIEFGSARARALPLYELGYAYWECGDVAAAIDAFERAASEGGGELSDQARRYTARLHAGAPWAQSALESLAMRLMNALRTRDADALSQLIARTNFFVGGAASDGLHVSADHFLACMIGDLQRSAVTGNPLQLLGAGGKRTLVTNGWTGSTFVGRVQFVLVQHPDGWDWGGLGLWHWTPEVDALARAARDRGTLSSPGFGGRVSAPPGFVPSGDKGGSPGPTVVSHHGAGPGGTGGWHPEPSEEERRRLADEPLDILIKAPWPAGISFQAGGVIPYIAMGPIEGFGLFVGALLSLRSCGYGPGGFYYDLAGQTPCGPRAICTDLLVDSRNCGLCGRNCGVRDDGSFVPCVGGSCG